MSRFSITVGDRTFSSKTAALKFYKQILDKYSFGEALSDDNARNIIALGYKDFDSPENIVEFARETIAEFTVRHKEAGSKILSVIVG